MNLTSSTPNENTRWTQTHKHLLIKSRRRWIPWVTRAGLESTHMHMHSHSCRNKLWILTIISNISFLRQHVIMLCEIAVYNNKKFPFLFTKKKKKMEFCFYGQSIFASTIYIGDVCIYVIIIKEKRENNIIIKWKNN